MNNKTNSIVTIVLGVAVIILFIMQFSSKNESVIKSTPEEVKIEKPIVSKIKDSSNISGLKIAYVNSDTVTMHYEFNKKVTKELMGKQAAAESKLRKAAEQLQKDFQKFQQEAPIMGQSELERKQMEFMQREQEIAMMEQELAGNLADKGYQANMDYVTRTDGYLKKIGQELGYDYIIGYRLGDLIMYANPELDITDVVIELLNKEYLADQTVK